MKIRLAVLLVVAAAAVGIPAFAVCQGSCYGNEFGCVNPGSTCFDLITGCGTCRTIPIFGPCVCDSSRPPTPDDGIPWWSESVTINDNGSEFGLELQRRSPSTPSSASDRPLPIPAPGDRLCADQIGVTEILHHYNLPWGVVEPDRLEVRGTRFCVDILDSIDGEPDWLEFRVDTLKGFLPSFRPSALPAFETGDNHVVLDSLPSRGKLHVPSLTVVAEVHARLVNDLFRFEFPVPLRAGLRGTLDLDRGRLVLESAHLDAATPLDYGGPFPN